MYIKLSILWLKGNKSTKLTVWDMMPPRIHGYKKINCSRLPRALLVPGSTQLPIIVIKFSDHIVGIWAAL